MDLSVIILNYNTKDLTRKCLRSVFGSRTQFRVEAIVSDNGSKDGSQEMIRSEFPQAGLVENNANLGFSKGNNAAIRQAKGNFVLLLNSDTEVRPDTFDLCLKRFSGHPEIGALGCRVLLPDGSLDKACRRKFPNPWNSFLRLFGLRRFSDYNIESPIDREADVDAVTGAFMMVSREAIARVGMLDEDFFMYGEDLDWCWRIKEAGYRIIYFPAASITHFKYGSSQLIPFRTIRMAHVAMKLFYRKHYAAERFWLFNLFVYLGIDLRMYLVLVVNSFRKKKTIH
ncbi:MAG: glycosyltransferase family 2 protein [Candidatus Saccharibacteria bacterium]